LFSFGGGKTGGMFGKLGIPGSISLNSRIGFGGETFSWHRSGVSHIMTAAMLGQRVSL